MTDDATQPTAATDAETAEDSKSASRDKSTIQFPYLPLEEAVLITKGIHAVGGNSCQIDQLAAHLNQKPNTGPFRVKLGTTKMFGLITHSMGTATLTPLGQQLCDPQQEQLARAKAFLQIPLYERVYEQFKGATLPPSAGLEAAMASMGVAPKQKATARQVFHRSAQFAGFFWSSPGRLVYPPIKGAAAGAPAAVEIPPSHPDSEKQHNPQERKGNGGGGNGSGVAQDYHPFIVGLLKTLPGAESEWPMDDRRKWLQAAATIFEVIYKDSASKGSLRIEVHKEPAK